MFETTWLFTLPYDKWLVNLFPGSIDKKSYGESLFGFFATVRFFAFSSSPLSDRALKKQPDSSIFQIFSDEYPSVNS